MKIERKNKTSVSKPLTIYDIAVGTIFNVNVAAHDNPMIKGESVSIGLQNGQEFSHDYWEEGDDFILVNAKLALDISGNRTEGASVARAIDRLDALLSAEDVAEAKQLRERAEAAERLAASRMEEQNDWAARVASRDARIADLESQLATSRKANETIHVLAGRCEDECARLRAQLAASHGLNETLHRKLAAATAGEVRPHLVYHSFEQQEPEGFWSLRDSEYIGHLEGLREYLHKHPRRAKTRPVEISRRVLPNKESEAGDEV